jgi:hypothetical protein
MKITDVTPSMLRDVTRELRKAVEYRNQYWDHLRDAEVTLEDAIEIEGADIDNFMEPGEVTEGAVLDMLEDLLEDEADDEEDDDDDD